MRAIALPTGAVKPVFYGIEIVSVASASYMTNCINIQSFSSGSSTTVDWGDGTIESVGTGIHTHTYSSEGEYTVNIGDGVESLTTFTGTATDASQIAMQYMWKSIYVNVKNCFDITRSVFRSSETLVSANYNGNCYGSTGTSATFWGFGISRQVTLTLNIGSFVYLPENAFDGSYIKLRVPASLYRQYASAGRPYSWAKSIEII